MGDEDECEREMFVEIAWEGDVLAVPLIQIEAPKQMKKLRRRLQIGIIG